jgi:outer membrane protein TolC
MSRATYILIPFVISAAAPLASPRAASAQVDSLVALAVSESPTVRAAAQRIEGARARVGPASALPDPMLGVGVMNLPLGDPGLRDFMTMTALTVQQTLPYPGKRALATRTAELEVQAAQAELDQARLEVAAAVRREYYEIAYLDGALEATSSSRDLTTSLRELSALRYASASGDARDMLELTREGADLAARAVELAEARRAAAARLNALIGRASDTPVPAARIPERVVRAALPEPAEGARPGADPGRKGASPLPPVEELQHRAVAANPALRAHEAEIAAEAARVELMGRAHLPDFDLWMQYGQRVGNPDMLSFMVSAPVPLHRASRQDQEVAKASAELSALHAEHAAMSNELRAQVVEAVSDLERSRTQLALLDRVVVPQGRALGELAMAAYRSGSGNLADVIRSRLASYAYELAHLRALSDFAVALADLERAVGSEVHP